MMLMILMMFSLMLSLWMNDYILIGSLLVLLVLLVSNFFNLGGSVDVIFNELFFFDRMSGLMVLLSIWVIMLMVLVLKGMKNKNLMVFIYMVILMNLMLCFFSLSMVMFYIFFEIILIPIFFMVVFWGAQFERFSAGIYMFMYTLFGSLPLLLLILKDWINGGGLFLMDKFFMGVEIEGVESFFFFFAFLIKMPMYGVHFWLPKAHVEAPVMGSMILAGVLLKLGGYGIYRVLIKLSGGSWESISVVIMVVSLMGGLYVSIMCMGMVDLKMLIANSSVVHMGFVISGLFSVSNWSFLGTTMMMVSHGLCSSCLFFLSNIYYERFLTRNIIMLKGMGLLFPSLTLWWFIMSVFNMGAPPSMNFFSEIFLMGGVIKFSYFFLIFLVLISFFSSFFSLYMFSMIQHGKIMYLYSVKMIEVREYSICLFHCVPLVVFIMKMDMFMI